MRPEIGSGAAGQHAGGADRVEALQQHAGALHAARIDEVRGATVPARIARQTPPGRSVSSSGSMGTTLAAGAFSPPLWLRKGLGIRGLLVGKAEGGG